MSQKVECKFCGRELDPRGIISHERNCKENPENKGNSGGKLKTDGKVCTDCGGPNIRKLDRTNEYEAEAIRLGYTYLCLDCKEVFA